ncbi:MAG: hypothetical protein Q3979_02910 [Actinomycetaceae bacterium]|nr:hypothetical protein [Actinomycetaceae bacterium]
MQRSNIEPGLAGESHEADGSTPEPRGPETSEPRGPGYWMSTLLFRAQPGLLLLPLAILVGRSAMGYNGWAMLLVLPVLGLMFLFQLLFWCSTLWVAGRFGQQRLGPSWVPFAVYLVSAIVWPLAIGDSTDQEDIPSVLERLGADRDTVSGVGGIGLCGMGIAALVALVVNIGDGARLRNVAPPEPRDTKA